MPPRKREIYVKPEMSCNESELETIPVILETQKIEEEKKEDEKPQVFLDEKYKYIDDFGETLVGKKRPAIFIFDLSLNTINEV